MEQEFETTIQAGENGIELTLRRSILKGLSLTVKVHPVVEKFMQIMSTGDIVSVGTHGRQWKVPGNNVVLEAYVIESPLNLKTDDGAPITLERLGQPLLERISDERIKGAAVDRINISFLRLVGVSGEGGITISINGVYSKEAIARLRDKLAAASQRFYVEYLRPMELNAYIVTQGR